MTNGTTDVIQLAEQAYGLTRQDLSASENTDNPQEVINRSQSSPGVQALVAELANNGRSPQTPIAQHIRVPLRTGDRVLDWVRYSLTENGAPAGFLHHLLGPADEHVFAITRKEDGTSDYRYIQKGELARTVFDRQGSVLQSSVSLDLDLGGISVADVSCKDICNLICRLGLAGDIAACSAACLASGPGEVVCDPLCITLAAVGCFFGCDNVC